jgi:protein-tyrosine phosphatase
MPIDSLKILKKRNVTHILSCVPERPKLFENDGITYLCVAMSDTAYFDILECLETTNKFIEDAIRSKGCVLVHCQMGQSRSAATVVGYLMKCRKMSYDDAFDLVKSKRRFIGNSKLRFFNQLKKYEKRLSGDVDSTASSSRPVIIKSEGASST